MIEDRYLIWKLQRGSRAALCRIYRKYKNDLLKVGVVLTHDVNTAEDMVQDVFVKFAQSAPKIRMQGNLKRYLVACGVNWVRHYKRDQQRHEAVGLPETEDSTCPSRRPEQWAILTEDLIRLSKAMAMIPNEQCEVLTLYMQGNMTFRQIAVVQQTSINTVQGRYRYGISKLRSLLNGESKHESST